MKVASILRAKGSAVETTPPEAPLATVAHRLRDLGIGALVVSEDGTTLLGLIAERDLVTGLAEHGARLLERRVADVMTRAVVTCGLEDSITAVMARMTRFRVRHVPVVEAGRLCGLISLGDVVKYRLDELETEANILREAFLGRH